MWTTLVYFATVYLAPNIVPDHGICQPFIACMNKIFIEKIMTHFLNQFMANKYCAITVSSLKRGKMSKGSC